MKKKIVAWTIGIVLSACISCAEAKDVASKIIAYDGPIPAEGTETLDGNYSVLSEAIDINKYKPDGYFVGQLILDDDDASVTIEWEVSMDGVNFVEPLDEDGLRIPDICTSFAHNGGKDENGKEYFMIPKPVLGLFVRIEITPVAADNLVDNCKFILGVR